MEIFDRALGGKPNQKDKLREDVAVSASDVTDFSVPGGEITDAGLATNVSVGIRYIASWLAGVGAAALDNLMEDAATAEISRSQVWQWVKAGRFSRDQVLSAIEPWRSHDAQAAQLFEQVALSDQFVEFLHAPGLRTARLVPATTRSSTRVNARRRQTAASPSLVP